MLLSSNSPQQILSILNRQYGGDEKILQEILNEIKKVNFVSTLVLFEDFNCSVQNTAAVLNTISGDFFDLQKILAIYLSKLPEHIVMQWANFMLVNNISCTNVRFNVFANWIESMSKIVNDINFATHIQAMNYENNIQPADTNANRTVDRICKICKISEHFAEKCNLFLEANATKRWELAKKFHYCFNCLKIHKGFCRKKEVCKIPNCNRRHHELLHKYEENNVVAVAHSNSGEAKVLLKMLPLKISGPLGSVNVIAMLDEGSTLTLLDSSISDSIGLSGEEKSLCFKWTGNIFRNEPKSREVSAEITGENGSSFKIENIRTVPNLDLPSQSSNLKKLSEKYPDLKKFSISCMGDRKPMILISQQHATLIAAREVIEIDPMKNGPLLTRTKLGWALHGPVNWNMNTSNFICCQTEKDTLDNNLDAKLESFFSLENFGVCISKQETLKKTLDDKAIEVARSSIRLVNGQYEIKLPWKNIDQDMPNSFPMASQRFKCLERKFKKDRELKAAYVKQIERITTER